MGVYAISDIHGYYELWEQVKEHLNPEDKLYVLGDCNDRGDDGYRIIKEVYNRPNTVYLKGNHEDMLESALRSPLYQNVNALFINGGIKTFDDFMDENINKEGKDFWIQALNNLPLWTKYISPVNGKTFCLSHAGFNPPIKTFTDFLWDRYHFLEHCKVGKDEIIIHGHTPAVYLRKVVDGVGGTDSALIYDNGHKICLDLQTYVTGKLTMLNLDTMEEICLKRGS